MGAGNHVTDNVEWARGRPAPLRGRDDAHYPDGPPPAFPGGDRRGPTGSLSAASCSTPSLATRRCSRSCPRRAPGTIDPRRGHPEPKRDPGPGRGAQPRRVRDPRRGRRRPGPRHQLGEFRRAAAGGEDDRGVRRRAGSRLALGDAPGTSWAGPGRAARALPVRWASRSGRPRRPRVPGPELPPPGGTLEADPTRDDPAADSEPDRPCTSPIVRLVMTRS